MARRNSRSIRGHHQDAAGPAAWSSLSGAHDLLLVLAVAAFVTGLGAVGAGLSVLAEEAHALHVSARPGKAPEPGPVAFAADENACPCHAGTASPHLVAATRRAVTVPFSGEAIGRHGFEVAGWLGEPRFFLAETVASLRQRDPIGRRAHPGSGVRPAQAAWAAKFLGAQTAGRPAQAAASEIETDFQNPLA